MRWKVLALCMLSVVGPALADEPQNTVLTEDFEGDLSAWTGRHSGTHSGEIQTDPLDITNHALTFSAASSFGDICSQDFAVAAGQKILLTFDYLGFPRPGSISGLHGAFVGYADDNLPSQGLWLVATTAISGADPILIDDGTWHSYSVSFDPYAVFTPEDRRIVIMLEDHILPAWDVYFDNIRVEVVRPVSTANPTWTAVKALYDAAAP